MGRRARFGLYAAFAGLGGTAATIPALMPELEHRIGESVLAAIPLLFGGLLLGVLLSSPLLGRLRPSTIVAIGTAVQAAGLLTLTLAASVPFVLIAVGCAGVGFGLTEAGGSLLAKRMATGAAGRILAVLLGIVAAVAAIAPIGVAIVPGGVFLVPVLVATVQLSASIALVQLPLPTTAAPAPAAASAAASVMRTESSRRVLLVAGSALALYVGVETVFSGWSAVIPEGVLGLDPRTAALGTSAFWLCMASGRFLAAALMARGAKPLTLLTLCMSLAASALLLTIPVSNGPAVLAALAVAVVAMAPVYSLVLGEALDRLPAAAAARITGPLVACGALGGMLLPAILLGAGIDPSGRAPAAIAAVVCLLVAGGALVSAHVSRRIAPALAPAPASIRHASGARPVAAATHDTLRSEEGTAP